MKKFLLVVLLTLVSSLAMAEQGKGEPHDPNPRKDPDVQKGYNEHQKEHEKKTEKPVPTEEVKESGGTVKTR